MPTIEVVSAATLVAASVGITAAIALFVAWVRASARVEHLEKLVETMRRVNDKQT
jgi:hypothetical protein